MFMTVAIFENHSIKIAEALSMRCEEILGIRSEYSITTQTWFTLPNPTSVLAYAYALALLLRLNTVDNKGSTYKGFDYVRCAFSDRDLHSRMPLVPTPARLKRACV
jgi:hypothetical protein